MAKKYGSIKTEFTFFIVILLIGVISILSFFILKEQEKNLTNEVKERGLTITKNLANNIADFLLTEDELAIARILSDTMNNKGIKYAFVVDEKDKIKAHNNLELLGTQYKKPVIEMELETSPYKIYIFKSKSEKIINFEVPAIAKGKAKLGTVNVGLSYKLIEDALLNAYIKILIIALGAIVAGIIGAIFLGVTITKPIGILTEGAKIIGKGNLDYVIKVKSKNEIGQLASVFNMMTQDLKKAQDIMIKQQKMEKELEVAREIQLSLIPKDIVKIPGYEINAFYQAAKEVGGDYYDVLKLSNEKYCFIVGDVSGKGVPAALIMTMARSILRSEAAPDLESKEILRKLNSVIYKDLKEGMFITIFLGILDINRNVIDIASAGHNDTLICKTKSGIILPVNPKGFPIGADPGPRFDKVISNEKLILDTGDKVIAFTDGITEAMNSKNEEYGQPRLINVVKSNITKNSKEILDAIINDVNLFVNGHEQSDDISLLVFEKTT